MEERAENLADLVLDRANGHDIEEMKAHLEGIDALPGDISSWTASEQELTDRLGADLADVPAKLAAAVAEPDPFRTCFLLDDLKHRLLASDRDPITPTERDARRELEERLESAHDQILSRWADPMRSTVRRLAGLLREGRACAKTLVDLVETSSTQQHQSTHAAAPSTSLSRETNRLGDIMDEVMETVEAIPALDPADLPSWQLLQMAKSRIVEPHERNVLLFKGAVLISRADAKLSAIERDLLYSIAHRIHLSVAEAHRLIEHADPIRLSDFHGTPGEASDLIRSLHLCALADGVVGESEKRMLRRMASSLGIEEKNVEAILSDTTRGKEVDLLDSAGVKEHLASRMELPSGTYLPGNLHPNRLEELREILPIPPQEEILLAYEDRLLAEMLECAALTVRHLCICPAHGHAQCVDLNQLEGFGSQIHSATLNLSNGEKIKLSRSGKGFLELLWECLDQNLRSL